MRVDKKDLLLYAVTDRSWLGGHTLYQDVEAAIKGGATFIQLREKNLDEAHFLEEAKEIKELCKKYQVPFVITLSGYAVEGGDKARIDARVQVIHCLRGRYKIQRIALLYETAVCFFHGLSGFGSKLT